MTDPRRPSADEVRALVARIVDQTLESDTADAAPSDGRTVVAIAGDHGGWRLKDAIGAWLDEHGYVVRDCGTNSDEAVDYPDFEVVVIDDGSTDDTAARAGRHRPARAAAGNGLRTGGRHAAARAALERRADRRARRRGGGALTVREVSRCC